MLEITEQAQEKIRAVLSAQGNGVQTVRVSVPMRGKYAMNLEPEGKPAPDDTVLDFEGFQIFIDPASAQYVEGASLDWVETAAGGGFKFENPNDVPRTITKKEPPAGPEGDLWRRVQEILDEQINPAIASHGGYIDIIDLQDNVLYVQMGGGCQGCGMANVTLKQGVKRILQDQVPEIEDILDVTDHASGNNPYYAPSTK